MCTFSCMCWQARGARGVKKLGLQLSSATCRILYGRRSMHILLTWRKNTPDCRGSDKTELMQN